MSLKSMGALGIRDVQQTYLNIWHRITMRHTSVVRYNGVTYHFDHKTKQWYASI